ncbi:MAG: hypothetical protein AAGH74_02485 [Pseudomonadota bacterium]
MTAQGPDPAKLTDEELVAFLDNRLAPDRSAEIAAAAAGDPRLKERLDALALDMDTLQEGMAHLLAQAPEIAIPTVSPRQAWPDWRQVAAAVALFAVGLGAGMMAMTWQANGSWHRAVADYQVLYTAETVTGAPVPPETQQAGLDLVNTRLGLDLTLERMALEGLRFQRAQMLEFDGRPLAQLVFLDNDDNPIAFCLMAALGEERPVSTRLRGMNAIHWTDGGYQSIVIGPADPELIEWMSQELMARITT